MGVHDTASSAGKFDFGFMGESKNDDTQTPKSDQPAGTYPLTSKDDTTFAKPTQPDGSLIPNK